MSNYFCYQKFSRKGKAHFTLLNSTLCYYCLSPDFIWLQPKMFLEVTDYLKTSELNLIVFISQIIHQVRHKSLTN